MREGHIRPARIARPARAVLAVAALYALLLQAFLGALAPAIHGPEAPLCAPTSQGSPERGGADHGAACCLLGCRAPLATPAAAAAPAPERLAALVPGPRLEVEPLSRRPAARALGARGPPAA